ncbi:uncharacterized protein [Drosophila tropicalis]|uniref:uncharacterized protein n=1 Tax=Drosophila tropicalis TaxID=46794 RepID=UPI0035AB8DB1
MQQIWLTELGRDDALPPLLLQQWHEFLQDYPGISQLRIPRWLNNSDTLSWELHGFCDASQKAYGAALYVRVRYPASPKARVAKAGHMCAPRTTPLIWRAGGVSAAELSASSLWWHGPDWLQRDPEYWPTLNNELPDTQLEQGVQDLTTATTLLDDRREYIAEIRALGESRSLPSSSTLLNLNPFLDLHGILRSCGRLWAAESLRTKAIHLEATSDLTTERFLSKALEKDFLNATKLDIMKAFPQHILSWQVIPPSAPHMGGLLEAGVKSFKTLFYKSSTIEELSTLLCRIEACLNSRPISPISEDPDDLLALSPVHFLIGGPLLSIAKPEILVEPMSLINRWQRLKAIQQAFCRRWKSEYLKELYKRNKWKSPTRSLQTGDLVIVSEDNLRSNEWRLGRIERTLPGPDGLVRVADVTTARSSIRYNEAKLILLQDDRSPIVTPNPSMFRPNVLVSVHVVRSRASTNPLSPA